MSTAVAKPMPRAASKPESSDHLFETRDTFADESDERASEADSDDEEEEEEEESDDEESESRGFSW